MKLECSNSSALSNSVKEELCAAVTQSGKCSNKLVGCPPRAGQEERDQTVVSGRQGTPDEV